MTGSTENTSNATFTFQGKSYDFDSLEQKPRQLVNALRVAEAQINRHKNTLQVLEIGYQSMMKQLQEQLKNVKPLN